MLCSRALLFQSVVQTTVSQTTSFPSSSSLATYRPMAHTNRRRQVFSFQPNAVAASPFAHSATKEADSEGTAERNANDSVKSKAEPQPGQLVYLDETSIHGVPDLFKSPRKGHKLVWLLIMAAACIAMLVQLGEVAMRYINDQTDTSVSAHVPNKVPGILFCPQFRTIKPFNESGIDDDMERVLEGYSVMGREFTRHANNQAGNGSSPVATDAIAKVQAAVRDRSAGNIIEFRKRETLDVEQIFKGPIDVKPIPRNTLTEKLITSQGLCYSVEVDAEINANMAEYVLLTVTLNDSYAPDQTGYVNGLHYAYLGHFDSFGVSPQLSSRFALPKLNSLIVKTRVIKKINYKGRDGKRCRNYDHSDQSHCISKAVNSMCAECKVAIPASTSHPEEVPDVDHLCNYYIPGMYPCLMKLQQSGFPGMSERCPRPCIEHVYDYTLQISVSDRTVINLALDNLALSKTIEEYPRVTAADFLSSIGGTMGLYFGCSLLSIVQFGVFAVGSAALMGRCKTVGGAKFYTWT